MQMTVNGAVAALCLLLAAPWGGAGGWRRLKSFLALTLKKQDPAGAGPACAPAVEVYNCAAGQSRLLPVPGSQGSGPLCVWSDGCCPRGTMHPAWHLPCP